MTIATLHKVLTEAISKNTGLVGFVVQGWEDARAFTEAGSRLGVPVILQVGPNCRNHYPLPVLGKMLRNLADASDHDVVIHLDHAMELATCQIALDEGFSSIMYDGSRLPLNENITMSKKVSKLTTQYGASFEAEIGYVGYMDQYENKVTNPSEVKIFLSALKVDALAISVGNTHLQEKKASIINYDILAKINKITKIPLAVHGASGISIIDRKKMLKTFGVKKFNIGTELRQCFGQSLREILKINETLYDRIAILSAVEKNLHTAAEKVLSEISL